MSCVMHIVPSFGCGGLERVVVNLIKNDPTSTKHVVISLENDLTLKSELPESVPIFSLNKKPGLEFRTHFQLFNLIKRFKPIAVNTYNFGTIEYQTIAWICGVKHKIHSDHGLGGDPSNGQSKKRQWVRRLAAYFADHYVVVSQDLKNFVTKMVGVNEEKVKIIDNGVLVKETFKPKELLNDIEQKTPMELLTVGRLAPVKNQKQLIEAIALFTQHHPDKPIRLTVVGDGLERPNLELAIRENHCESSVLLAGMSFDVAGYMKSSDGFILSSLYEAMPMTVLEAMSYSLPVICTKVGGVTDFIQENEAILVESNDVAALEQAILALYLMLNEERNALALKGYHAVKTRYSIDNMIVKYLTLYGCR